MCRVVLVDQFEERLVEIVVKSTGEQAVESRIRLLNMKIGIGQQNAVEAVVQNRLNAYFSGLKLGGTLKDFLLKTGDMISIFERKGRISGERGEFIKVGLLEMIGFGAVGNQYADDFFMQFNRNAEA